MFLGIGILASVGCGNGSGSDFSHPGEQPYIIMIVVDTLRTDHMSVVGYGRNTTPNLDEFSQNAHVFENAISAAPWTVPSYVSLMTGMHAFNHNQNTPPDGTPVNHTMLPEYLQQEGYRTVRILANCFVESFGNGFDENYSYCALVNGREADQRAIDKAIDWLNNEDNAAHKFFMLIWLNSPHWPYEPNNEDLEEFVSDELYLNASPFSMVFDCDSIGSIFPEDLSPELQVILASSLGGYECYQDYRLYVATYDSEIRYVDALIGDFFSYLKNNDLYDKSMILFTADHGENMIDHIIYFSHGENLYHSLIHSPLMIKFSKQETQTIIDTPVRTIDALPTAFSASNIEIENIDGKSLLPFVLGSYVDTEDRPSLSYVGLLATGGTMVSVTTNQYKLIKTPQGDELYDLLQDPGETDNVISLYPEVYSSLDEYLSRFYSY
jgi:arylsulfatase A-like enzyme